MKLTAEDAQRWRHEAALTHVAIARAIRKLAESGAEIPFSLIAAAKAYGSENVEGAALLGPQLDMIGTPDNAPKSGAL